MTRSLGIWLSTCLALLAAATDTAHACTIAYQPSPEEVVRRADAIVRAKAVGYALPPADPEPWGTEGEPDSRVRFSVIEVLKGEHVPEQIVLPGFVVDRDDFNDHEVPYHFVRPGGRRGSCFANSYRAGAQFLLMLQKRDDAAYTVNWYALGPVNEQLRPRNDPWLRWVRDTLRELPAR